MHDKSPGRENVESSAAESIRQGEKALDVQDKLNTDAPEKKEKDSAEDAARWKNEG